METNDLSPTENLTKKYQLQEQLQITETTFKNFFNNSAIGKALVSTTGQWLETNLVLSRLLGYKEEEFKKLTFQDITHKDDLDKDLALVQKCLDGKISTYEMEKRYLHKAGRVIYAILAVSLIRDSKNKPLYFTAEIVDITHRKRAEERIKKVLSTAKEQNERLKNFAQIVSHNLRSHSGNISMLLDIYQNDYGDENEIITMLVSASDSLKETITHLNEVVSINTITANELKPVSIHKTLVNILPHLPTYAQQQNVEIINKVDKTHKVLAIEAYLESILLNFITNAIKYSSPDRKSFVEISSKRNSDFTMIKIKDNGLGIDLKKHGKKLFGMYKTFHEHKDAKGLGLFMSKNQIMAMKGRVKVKSEVDKGTTFKIYLKHE
ncbi:PAS domain S-box protein [Mesonia sp. K7]|uniref:sensor histidine kinase n=1 Tax=Mesonia sp. K7 TaxID=2218606 RepID=UPI000DAA02D6|nr:HAMP domain-containing sensor histidine kinase [Mesonia sp. K7]PZD77257.1 histidine kinase [Mesonia sp. K7]